MNHHKHRLCWYSLVAALLLQVVSASAFSADLARIQTDDLLMEIDRVTGRVQSLVNRADDAEWVNDEWAIYRLNASGAIEASLDATATPDGVRLTLQLRNVTDEPVDVTPTFPALQLRGRDAELTRALRYSFPARSSLVGTRNVSDRGYYSGIFPLQFFAADHPDQGVIYAVIEDTGNTRKLFALDKTDDALQLSATYETAQLAPGAVWRLPSVLLNTKPGTWHEGLIAYREWLATWYAPVAPRQKWFREVFNFRTYYLHRGQPRGTEIFEPQKQTLHLQKAVEQDAEAFGGVDFVHLFDWAYTAKDGRVGNYEPWKKFGGVDQFNAALDSVSDRGIASGLYIEGYLVTKQSPPGLDLGKTARMTDARGEDVEHWGDDYFTMCAHVPEWQDRLAAIYGQTAKQTNARGFYLDQFGFLTQYYCHNPAHAAYHKPGEHMLNGELQILQKVRQAVGDRVVLYTEEAPTDVMTQYIDGAYTASVNIAMKKGYPCPINLMRFALPEFKLIELISEQGLGHNAHAVRLCFFNGNGIYLSGDAQQRFAPETLATIRKAHRLLRKYSDAFTSADPMPLVLTKHEMLFANRFPGDERVVWVLYNGGEADLSGPAISVAHVAGATYYDAWNGVWLEPIVEGDEAILTLSIAQKQVGAVVQVLPTNK
ncbi:MAG: DUF6259 domain-containing protein [Phycisphaeraceae bacterium]